MSEHPVTNNLEFSPPPNFPPEMLPPERLTRQGFLEESLGQHTLSNFIGENLGNSRLNLSGRKFTTDLFGKLFLHCDGNFAKINEEIKKGFTKTTPGIGRLRIFQSLNGKLNWELGLASARFLARQNPEKLERKDKTRLKDIISYQKTFQHYFRTYCQKDITVLDEPDWKKAYLELLTQFDKSIREMLIKERNVEETRVRKVMEGSGVIRVTKRPLIPKIFRKSRRLAAAGLLAVIATVFNLPIGTFPFTGADNQIETLGAASFRVGNVIADLAKATGKINIEDGKPIESPLVKRGEIVRTGVPNLYSEGLWEKVAKNRVERKNPLNPELVKNPEVLKMIKEKRVVAVNPAFVNTEYETVLRNEIFNLREEGMSDEQIASRLEKSRKLKDMASRTIGKIIEVEMDDGRREKLVVMDVFQSVHAAKSMGLIRGPGVPRNFIGDFHPEWVRNTLGVTWNTSKGWQNLEGDSVKPPWVKIIFSS